jgi:hypothetical protein
MLVTGELSFVKIVWLLDLFRVNESKEEVKCSTFFSSFAKEGARHALCINQGDAKGSAEPEGSRWWLRSA